MYVRLVFRLLEMFKSSLFQTQRGCRRAEWGQRLSLDLANQLIIKLFNYECVWRTPSCCIFNSEEAGGMWERLRAPDDSFAGCSASSARAEDPTLAAEREGGLGGGGSHPRTANCSLGRKTCCLHRCKSRMKCATREIFLALLNIFWLKSRLW